MQTVRAFGRLLVDDAAADTVLAPIDRSIGVPPIVRASIERTPVSKYYKYVVAPQSELVLRLLHTSPIEVFALVMISGRVSMTSA